MLLDSQTEEYQRIMAEFALIGANNKITESNKRLEVYHDLISSGIEDALARAYPLTKKLLSAKGPQNISIWELLINEYKTLKNLPFPELWKMPKGFKQYVKSSDFSFKSDFPFIDDLLAFEWEEIEIYMMPDKNHYSLNHQASFFSDKFAVNLEHSLLELTYPVFKPINHQELKRFEGQYHLLTYRHPKNLNVNFLEVSPIICQILNDLTLTPLTYEQIFQKISRNISQQQTDQDGTKQLRRQLEGLLLGLLKEEVILGFLK